jgi:hypothetical protein
MVSPRGEVLWIFRKWYMRPVLGKITQRDFGDFGESDLTKYFKGGVERDESMGK